MMALPELDTRTVLNVVEENFQKLGLKAYAIRMIYIGEHTLPKEEIIHHFSKTITLVNSTYCEINVYGLLLVYDSYFVHILEGSEDTIHRHLRFLFKREAKWIADMEKLDQEANGEGTEGLTILMSEDTEPKPERKMFRRLKSVMTYHSVRTLQFKNWRAVTARPPSLIGKLDLFGPLQEHLEQLRIFLNKISKICEFAQADEELSFEGLRVIDPKMEALPEVALLDFLLQSPHILPLRETAALHRHVDDYRYYFEDVWPLPTHFTPRFLYKLKIDDSFVEPLPVMPWENVKKEGEDEERDDREEPTDGSSSD
ncbi:uncharacterized protein LOC110370233 [Helicoverpa armigera]|uniref:uncharacterized protein LOC110370233 n=1 Tax=Helicoverpa armigera TaxID=29058 RepID=UPI000B36EC23|nr:uncharacterized protein LOC110370233 [Helicoverpa armigera]XP_047027056.1 uncharacterized protein LOC124635244 [Helicoverpa zea]PZC84290.1 hypothetical protein B5X24_HaOG205485 [Helicoverpa armigera]